VLLGAALGARAQQVPSFAGGTQMVTLTASAVDGRGRPVLDLRSKDIQVLENGRPQRLAHFSQADLAPAKILVLVDGSGSMTGDKPARARLAFLRLLAGLTPRDEAALASFDRDYTLRVPFTTDRARLLQAYDTIPSFGMTALYDALSRAAADVGGSEGEGRRAIVAFTDGVDNASRLTPAQAVHEARAMSSPVYAISVLSPHDDPDSDLYLKPRADGRPRWGRAVLQGVTDESGGTVFVASDLPAVETAITRILNEVRHQYRLGYDPPPGPPGFRRIEVRSTRRGVVMRARKGYLAR
jgi:Ca-activated chloride channel family protein